MRLIATRCNHAIACKVSTTRHKIACRVGRRYTAPMGTEVKTEVSVLSSTACAAIIQKINKNQSENIALFLSLAHTARKESERNKYDEKQTRQMLVLSWRVANDWKETNEALTASFDNLHGPDVSKAMRLAFPVSPEAKQELDACEQHNQKVGLKIGRIGVNRLLQVARGQLTASDAKSGKKQESAKSKSTGAIDKLVKPSEQLHNDIAGLLGTKYKGKVTLDEVKAVFAKIIAEREPAKKA
jgi:hypothetical protein